MANNSSDSVKNDIIIKGLNLEQTHAIKTLFEQKKWSLDIGVVDENDGISTKCADYFIPPTQDKTRCPFCFCQPCITDNDNRQLWWCDSAKDPEVQNSGKRKDCYRRFWAMMFHRGVWNTEEYKIKKDNILSQKKNETVIVMREIMPECVLKTVRGWYPNPSTMPYMGHKWN